MGYRNWVIYRYQGNMVLTGNTYQGVDATVSRATRSAAMGHRAGPRKLVDVGHLAWTPTARSLAADNDLIEVARGIRPSSPALF